MCVDVDEEEEADLHHEEKSIIGILEKRNKRKNIISIMDPYVFWITECVCLFVTFYPHHQFSKGSPCLFVTLYPHHQLLIGCVVQNFRAERHRRKVRR